MNFELRWYKTNPDPETYAVPFNILQYRTSSDGGTTWTEWADVPTVVDPALSQ